MKTSGWKHGDQKKLAALAGVHNTQLNDIINGRAQCRPTLAVRLEEAAKKLGYDVPRLLWCFQDARRGNPLFPKFCK